jgi:AraC-like DNA-binding protein
MTKPFQAEVLISRIENLIRQRESMREAFRKSISTEPSAVYGTTSDERFMKNVIAVIEEHIGEPEFGVDELCDEIGISRPTLYRKIKSLTGLSAIRFLRSIRLKRAAQLLAADENLSVSSVMYSTGFNNMSYFSKIFFEEFHILPKDYRSRKHE